MRIESRKKVELTLTEEECNVLRRFFAAMEIHCYCIDDVSVGDLRRAIEYGKVDNGQVELTVHDPWGYLFGKGDRLDG